MVFALGEDAASDDVGARGDDCLFDGRNPNGDPNLGFPAGSLEDDADVAIAAASAALASAWRSARDFLGADCCPSLSGSVGMLALSVNGCELMRSSSLSLPAPFSGASLLLLGFFLALEVSFGFFGCFTVAIGSLGSLLAELLVFRVEEESSEADGAA